MPARRGERSTIFKGAMSRSKQLGGFPISGVFDSGRTHAHAAGRQAALHTSDSAPGSIGVINRGIGAKSISLPT